MSARAPNPAELVRHEDEGPPPGACTGTACGGLAVRGPGSPERAMGCPSPRGCGPQDLLALGLSEEEASLLEGCWDGPALIAEERHERTRRAAQLLAGPCAAALARELRACRAGRPSPGTLFAADQRGDRQVGLAVAGGYRWLWSSGRSLDAGRLQADFAHLGRPVGLLAYDLSEEQALRAAQAPAAMAAAVAVAPRPEPGRAVPSGDQLAWRQLPVGTVVRAAPPPGRAPTLRVYVDERGGLRYAERTSGGWQRGVQAEPWHGASRWQCEGARASVVEALGFRGPGAARGPQLDELERRRAAGEAAGWPALPGELLPRAEAWEALPEGSVVDVRDGTTRPYAVRGPGGWAWASAEPPQDRPAWETARIASSDMWRNEPRPPVFLGVLPERPVGAAFAGALAGLREAASRLLGGDS